MQFRGDRDQISQSVNINLKILSLLLFSLCPITNENVNLKCLMNKSKNVAKNIFNIKKKRKTTL